MEDVETFIDAVIYERGSLKCDKVTLVPHGTAFSEDLIAAARVATVSDKISRIVNLAPCLDINTSTFVIQEGELPSYEMLYKIFMELPSLPQDLSSPAMVEWCGTGTTIYSYICNQLQPAIASGAFAEGSLYYYQHVH